MIPAKGCGTVPSDGAKTPSSLFSFLRRFGWWLLPLFTLLLLVDYLFGAAEVEFHSDCTDTLLWAATSHESGRWIDPDFSYACILPFGGQLLMQLFLPVFGVSMAAHRGGMLLFLLLFAASLVWMLWEMGWRLPLAGCVASALLLLLTASAKLREIFYGHIIYYSLGIWMMCVALALTFRLLRKMTLAQFWTRRSFLLPASLLFLWLLLCSLNGTQAVILCVFPLLFALLGERFFTAAPLRFRTELPRIAVAAGILAALALGLCLRSLLLGDVVASYAESYSTFSDPKLWASNLLRLPEHWFTLLGVPENCRFSFVGSTGILTLLQVVAGGLLLLMPPAALAFYRRFSQSERILLLANTALTVGVLFAWIFGNLSVANWRLSPVICTATLSSVLLLKQLCQIPSGRRHAAVLALPLAIFCLTCTVQTAILPRDPALSPLWEVEQELQSRNLSYGYASFWQASAITVQTDSAVVVRPIVLAGERGIAPYHYQSAARWYGNMPSEGGRWFLLFTKEEYEVYRRSFFAECQLHQTEEAEVAGLVLLIFDQDPILAAAQF